MRKKVGIMMDYELYKKVKIYCAKKDISISELFSYAVEIYIDRMESIEEEMKNRKLEDLIEDNYSEIVKHSVDSYVIGPEIGTEE